MIIYRDLACILNVSDFIKSIIDIDIKIKTAEAYTRKGMYEEAQEEFEKAVKKLEKNSNC